MVLPINFEQLWKEELKNSSGVYSSRILDDEIETDFWHEFIVNQRIIAGNAQFAGIAAGRGVRFTTGLLLLGKGLGMRETPIRPHS